MPNLTALQQLARRQFRTTTFVTGNDGSLSVLKHSASSPVSMSQSSTVTLLDSMSMPSFVLLTWLRILRPRTRTPSQFRRWQLHAPPLTSVKPSSRTSRQRENRISTGRACGWLSPGSAVSWRKR